MNIIKHTHDLYVEENSFVRARTFAHVTADGVYLGKMEIMNRLIQPDEDYSNETGKIRRACDSQFVPTVVARHIADKAYEKAVSERQQAVAAQGTAEAAKEAAFQKEAEALAAYDAAVLADIQADIDEAKAHRDKAIAADKAAQVAKDAAITKATEAKTARDAALVARDKARKAQDDFEAAEG